MTRRTTIKTVILCGGRGTRAYPHTAEVPKPLLEVNGSPILLHVMRIFAQQGFMRFVLAAGFRGDMIRHFADGLSDWEIEVIDTGEEAHKGSRVLAARYLLEERFFVTYGDGLGNINLDALVTLHDVHGSPATVTVVPLPSQYGTLELDPSDRVERFVEKPRLDDHWINAGFMCMDQAVFDDWDGDLETDVLPRLSDRGALYAYRHHGFWKSMDTYKDSVDLDALARGAEVRREPLPWLA
jgi:glucose-1-phosphate cytidylyltransferase